MSGFGTIFHEILFKVHSIISFPIYFLRKTKCIPFEKREINTFIVIVPDLGTVVKICIKTPFFQTSSFI